MLTLFSLLNMAITQPIAIIIMAAENTSADNTATSNEVNLSIWRLGLHSWEQLMLGALGLTGFIAIAVFIATACVVILTRRENAEVKREYAQFKLTVDGKVADAKKEGIEAGKTASNALLRAAELEKEAAAARLETEKLKGVVAWRTVTSAQGDTLMAVWSARPGSVNLYWQDGDPEALFFAIQFANVLQQANWKISARGMKPSNGILFELIVPPVAGADADALRTGLIAAGIPYSAVYPAAIQGGFSSFGGTMDIPGAPMFLIGSRKPVIP